MCTPHDVVITSDDLEEEFLSNFSGSQLELMNRSSPLHVQDDEPVSENSSTKTIVKGGVKWRGWSWKHGNNNKESVEDDDQVSPMRRPRRGSDQKSAHDSPTKSNSSSGVQSKTGSRRGSKEVVSPKNVLNSKSHNNSQLEINLLDSSPRRRVMNAAVPFYPSPTCAGNRMSAGARLCKVFEESLSEDSTNETADEEILQSMFIAGRPASVSLLQTAGSNYQL